MSLLFLQSLRGLLFSTFLTDKVGGAKAGEHHNTRAEGGTSTILVIRLTMDGNARNHGTTAVLTSFFSGTTLEQTAVIGASESGHAQSEDDSYCQC